MSAAEFPPQSLLPAITRLSQLLHSKSHRVAIAETATGGLLSSTLLSQPRASKIYAGGLTLYTLPSRISYAGWTDSDISSYAGPSPSVVAGIARHVSGELKADWTLAESGTAGPTGGKGRGKEPGYTALAVVGQDGKTWTREIKTGLSERAANMVAFAKAAIEFLTEVVEGRREPNGEGEEEGKL